MQRVSVDGNGLVPDLVRIGLKFVSMSAYWPPLAMKDWRGSYATLHRMVQVVGKIQLGRTPLTNHFWNAALRLTSRGLVTSPMSSGDRRFDIEFDFVAHMLVVRTSDGLERTLRLAPRSVADFYRDLLALLGSLEIAVAIDDRPVELLEESIPFHSDRIHASYDPEMVSRSWRVLSQSAAIFEEFRGRFIGKSSPVHFFWGSFDLAVSRFSGHRAPVAPEASSILREAYFCEVSSAGFWPGDVRFPLPAYYAYFVPAPEGYSQAVVRPGAARWQPELGEFILPYETVRAARSPRTMLLDFLQSTYEAGAKLAGWPRAELEREEPPERPQPPWAPSPTVPSR